MKQLISRLTGFSLSRRALARVMMALFALSLIPLIVIALYNYPADDDFEFVLPAAQAWLNTGSLGSVLKAIAEKTCDKYQTWQGNFFSTALFGITPMVFGVQWYFLDNWMMLALLCLSVGYMLKALVCHCLKADKHTFWIVYSAAMVLVVQFMPSISYSVFWHNGGQYTTAACSLFIALGLVMRCTQEQTKRRSILRGICLAFSGIALGGSFYGPALGAFVLMALITLVSWIRRDRSRVHCAILMVFFTVSLAISAMAPGVALRQERTGTGESAGVLYTVITAVLDSFDLCGGWLSPQLLAMLLLILPALWKPLKESRYSFRCPLGAFVMLYGLFSASLAPGIYTGFGYDTARYMNVVYFYFLVMAVGSAIYFEGAFIRWLERAQSDKAYARHLLEASAELGKRFCAVYLAVVIFFTAMGGFGFTIMNTSSVSALKSLATGEAKQFRQEMAAREEYIRVTDSDVVDVKPLSVQPYVFKNDRLPWQGIYGRVRYMKWYFEAFYNVQQK